MYSTPALRVRLQICVHVCSGMHFLNNGNLVSLPNLKKLLATKLGFCHGSKYTIPLIEKIMKHTRDTLCTFCSINQFYCLRSETLHYVQISQVHICFSAVNGLDKNVLQVRILTVKMHFVISFFSFT